MRSETSPNSDPDTTSNPNSIPTIIKRMEFRSSHSLLRKYISGKKLLFYLVDPISDYLSNVLTFQLRFSLFFIWKLESAHNSDPRTQTPEPRTQTPEPRPPNPNPDSIFQKDTHSLLWDYLYIINIYKYILKLSGTKFLSYLQLPILFSTIYLMFNSF